MGNLTWTDVVRLHQTNEGISVVGGRAVSLICNTGKRSKYPNRIFGDRIEYVVGPKTNRSAVAALVHAASENATVRVFTKLATDDWVELGSFVIERGDAPDAMGFQRFHLMRVRIG